MKKSDISQLRELIALCKGHRCYKAWLDQPGPPCVLAIQLEGEQMRLRDPNPWVVEDWQELNWIGAYFFHRSCTGVYLVHGTDRAFDHAIYRPRLRAFKKMVQWAIPGAEVGFTVLDTVSERWGYMLVSPWLIKSTDPVWLQRIKLFSALNEFDAEGWPMSLLLKNWEEVRRIRF